MPPTPSLNRTFAPDGAGGWREVTTLEEKRAVAQRIMLAAYGITDPHFANQAEAEKSPTRCISSGGAR